MTKGTTTRVEQTFRFSPKLLGLPHFELERLEGALKPINGVTARLVLDTLVVTVVAPSERAFDKAYQQVAGKIKASIEHHKNASETELEEQALLAYLKS